MQMICALLIFQTPDLPDPLWSLSPWLDSPTLPQDRVYAQLAGQRHRRFIKTHTPLNEIPSDPRVTYIVTARHPLDAFVSLYYQDSMFGPPPVPPPGQPWAFRPPGPGGPPPWPPGPPPGPPRPPGPLAGPPPRPPAPEVSRERLHEALVEWIGSADDSPRSLPGAMRYLSDAWARRGEPNVVLVHYDDLLADLEGQMRWLAGRLGIAVPEQSWPVLGGAATFKRMRNRGDIHPLPPSGIAPDATFFFRRGTSGAGREILSDEELAHYYARAAQLAPPDLFEWLHRQVMGG